MNAKATQKQVNAFVTKDDIVTLASEPIPFQRNHGGKASKKKYLHTELWGTQLIFVAVHVAEKAKTWLVDGYHRATLLETGHASLPDYNAIQLVTFTVETMAEAECLYDQINTLESAKRSGDEFDSGLRRVGLLHQVTSPLMLRGGRAIAVQLAYGKKGSRYTRDAVVAVKEGIVAVDNLQLERHREIAGQLGGYIAIAQHCKDSAKVESFIRRCNQAVFKTEALSFEEYQVMVFRNYVATKMVSRTGGKANDLVFEVMLGAFVSYLDAPDERPTAAQLTRFAKKAHSAVTLAEFIRLMRKRYSEKS